MKSEQVHVRQPWPRVFPLLMLAAMLWTCLALPACDTGEKLVEPRMFPSPYPGPKLWAVVPFRNEAGTTVVDGVTFADKLNAHLQQIEGIRVLPTNRVIEAMKARKIADIRSVTEAMGLMDALGVDGLLVGVINAWDPYDPPKIGATVQLYSRQSDLPGGGTIDTRAITRAATDPRVIINQSLQPVNTAGSFFDAANHAVLKNLQAYASGRTGHESPAGWRRYLLNMDLYSEYVSFELMRLLFKAEWNRLTVPATTPGEQPTDKQTTKP